MIKLNEEQCQAALNNGDFDASLISGSASAIILTQSWCPQWAAMKTFIPELEDEYKDLRIYYVEYDIETWNTLKNEDFMAFKENKFGSREIPYVRYYQNGKYLRDGNFISKEGFKSRLGL